MKIGILNGPNLGRLGKREPDVYGSETLEDLEAMLKEASDGLSCDLVYFQSNHEGELIDCIEAWADEGVGAIIINPGALTHTSVALRDAIRGSSVPCAEVHLSNVYAREDFRKKSLTAPVCQFVISGMGFYGYEAALLHFLKIIQN